MVRNKEKKVIPKPRTENIHKAQNVTAKPRTGDIQISEDTDFKSMLLPQPILEGLKKAGYIKPSPIQKKALPLVRCGLDLIVQAKAGTGKTCVFTVAVLELVKPSLPHLQAIVLAPTREIALQITSVISAIGQCIKGLKTSCFIGGYPLSSDMEKVKGCHVAVAAPGRLKHLLDKGLLNPRHVRLFVLDEADKLMEKVFVKDIDTIFSQLPESKQVLACSATYTDQLVDFLANYMNSGQWVSPELTVGPAVLLGVRQFVSIIPRHVDRLAQLKLKEKQLLYLLRSISFNQCLVFSNLHTRAVSLCGLLRGEGWGVEWIAGRQEQKDRVAALTQLRDQRVRVLVTTDLTARGIDVENVNLVINLDLPTDHHTYLHRMGRAGRYGSHGIVITVVSDGLELTGFQKLIGMIGGTEQAVNRIPQTLKNADLWTMPDEKFEKISGIIEEKTSSTSSSEEKEDSSTSTAEKYSPESSDSDDYVNDYKGENGTGHSNGVVNHTEIIFDKLGNSQGAEKTEETRDISAVSIDVADDNTSTDEKLSRDSSDSEGHEEMCACNLYDADASDIKVIAGPSLFALKKEDHWREVLPVIVNESKVPLNTPIALLDSKLIRVKFWDKSQRFIRNIQDHIPTKEVVKFDTQSKDPNLISFKDIVSFLENGIKNENFTTDFSGNAERQIMSYKSVEEALENGFFETNERIFKSKEVEQVLRNYNLIKENSENALVSFDSFDLVGWLAVDESHNIIEEINIDNCEIFLFKLLTCGAGKNHIEVLSPPPLGIEDSSKETHDYIDHISTLNLERFPLQSPFSLSSIARQLTKSASSSFNKVSSRADLHEKSNNKLAKQTVTEEEVIESSHDTKNNTLNSDFLKVPIFDNSNNKCTKKRNVKNFIESEGETCKLSSLKETSNVNGGKANDSTNQRLTSRNNIKGKCERRDLPESNKPGPNQVSKNTKLTKIDHEFTSVETLKPTLTGKNHQMSSNLKSSDDSGSFVDMSGKHLKGVQATTNKNSLSSGDNSEKLCVLPHIENSSILYQLEPGVQNKNRHHNGFGHSQRHRNSDDSYDSFDSVEYETTDLDKELCQKMLNENGAQRKHRHTKHHDSTSICHSMKSTSTKIPHSKLEKSKSYDCRNKQYHMESQDTYSSIESEGPKLHPKSFSKAVSKKEPNSKTKNLHRTRHNTLQNDTEESYKESYDSYNSIETEISKLRELNCKLNSQEKVKRKHHNSYRHRQILKKSDDEDSSVKSGGTNRHSFRTACSQHLSEEDDHLYNGISNRGSRLSNHFSEHQLESEFRTARCSEREVLNKHYYHDNRDTGEKYYQNQEHFQNPYGYGPHGSEYCPQFESYPGDGSNFQQDFSCISGGGTSQMLRGENLHQEWYSNWYLRVRQRAIQLAMMDYTNAMSTL